MGLDKEEKADLEFTLEDLSGQLEEFYDFDMEQEILNNIEALEFHVGESSSLEKAEEVYEILNRDDSAFDKIIKISNSICPSQYLETDNYDFCNDNTELDKKDLWLSHNSGFISTSYSTKCFYCWLRVLCDNQKMIDKVWNIFTNIAKIET